MARTGRNFTRDLSIEARQHSIMGLDLGEGPSRRVVAFGAIVFPVWLLAMWPLLGVPSPQTFTLYFLPPAIITWFGMREGNPKRRRRITQWVLALRYPLIGHRPIIKLGRVRPTSAECLPLSERWHLLGTVRSGIVPGSAPPAWADDRDAKRPSRWHHQPTSKPIAIRQRSYLMGSGHLYDLLTRKRKTA